jgi:aryl-alcohol dehydrogenase-like predicted oxidoreductase
VPACEHNGLGLLPWSPLAGGWLSGKYTREARPTGATRLGEDPSRGIEAYDRVGGQARTWDVLEAVQDVAEAHAAPMPQVALAWLLARPAVTSVILGARTLEQLVQNLGAADLVLAPEEHARLDQVSAPDVPDYPYGGPGQDQRSRKLEGGR